MKLRWTSILVMALVTVLLTGASSETGYGATGKQMQGSGTGSVKCPVGMALPATIQANLTVDRGDVSGFVQIFGSGIFIFGNATGGRIGDAKTYVESGIVGFTTCAGGTTPTTFTVDRDCGPNVTIEFRAADGTVGSFLGNVACA